MGRGIEIDLQSIEWENLGPSWEIESLEPSEYLPEGAEKAEVWCRQFALPANVFTVAEKAFLPPSLMRAQAYL